MAATGLVTFDKTLQVTHSWLNDLSSDLGWDDKHKVFQSLRITLHALRDRITVEQASKLASQLPVLLIGFFYEDWQPATTPHKERTKEAFLSHIQDQLAQIDPNIDSERVVRAVFMLPKALKALWPVAVQAQS